MDSMKNRILLQSCVALLVLPPMNAAFAETPCDSWGCRTNGKRYTLNDATVGAGFTSGTGRREVGTGGGRGSGKANTSQNNTVAVKDPCDKSGAQNPSPSTKNPVILATGEKFKDEVDFTSGGLYGLSLQRTYRSKQTVGGMFGPNWMSSLEAPKMKVSYVNCVTTSDGACVPRSVDVIDSNGGQYTFRRSGGYDGGGEHYYSGVGADAGSLTYSWGMFTHSKNNTTYDYDGDGTILGISDSAGGGTLGYTYDSMSRLTRITNMAGKAVVLTWTGDRVTQVTDPDGKIWTYSYNANRMLTKVTSPGDSNVRHYHYENSDPSLLTGISIDTTRYSTYKYYADKRVSESGLTGGEEVDKFVYGTYYTDVTDARNQTTRYAFASMVGGKKLTGISRSASATCSASTAQTVYDLNGFVDYSVDWNGVTTDYTYDAAGYLLTVVHAAGTSSAKTTTIRGLTTKSRM